MLSQLSMDTIRLAIHLAAQPANNYIRISDIADEIGISYYKLAKVAQNLTRAGVLESQAGPNGGFRFKENPYKICLLDMLEAIHGAHSIDTCVLGISECGENNPCRLHNHWKVVEKELGKFFTEKSLAELIGLEDQILQNI